MGMMVMNRTSMIERTHKERVLVETKRTIMYSEEGRRAWIGWEMTTLYTASLLWLHEYGCNQYIDIFQ